MVRIRMSRFGRPHRPFYRISAVDSRVKRDGSVIEQLGWYDPMAKGEEKTLVLEVDRIKYWISKGAQPSDTVRAMLAKQNLVSAEDWKKDHDARVKAKQEAAAKLAANPPKEEKKA